METVEISEMEYRGLLRLKLDLEYFDKFSRKRAEAGCNNINISTARTILGLEDLDDESIRN